MAKRPLREEALATLSNTGAMGAERVVRRSRRAVVTAAVLAALVAPVVVDRDSFPLSTYPMYSRARGNESTIVTAQGVGADGTPRTLTPWLIGASDDPLVVVGRLRAALSAGRGDARCGEIAARVAGRASLDDIDTIEIVGERHDTVARTLGTDSLIDRDVRASCEVPGR